MTAEALWQPLEQAEDSERIVLGTMMMLCEAAKDDGVAAAKVSVAALLDACPPARYGSVRHRAIATAIQDVFGRGRLPDAEGVAKELVSQGVLAKLPGGQLYLFELAQRWRHVESALVHAQDVCVEHQRYEAFRYAQWTLQVAGDARYWTQDETPLEDILKRAAELGSVRGASTKDDVQTLGEDINELWERLLDPPPAFVRTGFLDLDEVLTLDAGDVTTFAARTGVGKTLFAGTLARHVAMQQQHGVYFGAIEMSKLQMAQRHLAAVATVRLDRLRHPGRLEAEDLVRLDKARTKLAGVHLFHDYASMVTIPFLDQRLTVLRRGHPDIRLVVVDHLGIVSATKRYERRQLELKDIMRGLRELAAKHETHVLALHQLNRAVEHRADGIPNLADLRESGDVEQDSANVLFGYLPKEEERRGEFDVLVGKGRHGGIGARVTLAYQPHYQRVSSFTDPS